MFMQHLLQLTLLRTIYLNHKNALLLCFLARFVSFDSYGNILNLLLKRIQCWKISIDLFIFSLKEFLRGFQAVGENYKKALAVLCERSGGNRKLLNIILRTWPRFLIVLASMRQRYRFRWIRLLGLRSTGNYNTEPTQR